MPASFAEVIEIRPRTARWLVLYGLSLVALGSVALQWVALDPCWKLMLALLVGLRLSAGLRRRVAESPDHVGRVLMRPCGDWRLEVGRSRLVEARLRRSWGGLHGPIVGMEWACVDGRTYEAWLTPLDMPPATWRRLRVRLSLA